jgi:hypothetical protein
VQSTESLKNILNKLKSLTKNSKAIDKQKAKKYEKYYKYIDVNHDKLDTLSDSDIMKYKSYLKNLFVINGISTKALDATKKIDGLKQLYLDNKEKIERSGKYINRKKEEENFSMESPEVVGAIQFVDNFINNVLKNDADRKSHIEEYISRYDAMMTFLNTSPIMQDDEKKNKQVNRSGRDFRNYKYLVDAVKQIDVSKILHINYDRYNDIKKAPYINVYNYLKNRYEAPNQQLAFEETKGDDTATGDDTKTGNGLKKMNKIFKRRVY